jgi:hypothetical protein
MSNVGIRPGDAEIRTILPPSAAWPAIPFESRPIRNRSGGQRSAHRFLRDSVPSLRSLRTWDCCRSGIEREGYERTVQHFCSWESPPFQSLQKRAGSAHTAGPESWGIKGLRKKAPIFCISYLVTQELTKRLIS